MAWRGSIPLPFAIENKSEQFNLYFDVLIYICYFAPMTRELFEQKLNKVTKLFHNIGATNKRLAKTALLQSYDDSEFLQRILLYTYNPFFVYGINSKTFKSQNAEDVFKTQFSNVFDLLDYLKITSVDNDTKTLVRSFVYSFESSNLLEMIIMKNLKIGIDIETINKVFKGLIPTFKVQLCEPYEKPENIKSSILYVEPKLDGVRCLVIVKDGGVEIFTRNGSKIEGYDDIESEMSAYPIDFVYDGEIIGENFDNTMEGLFAKGTRKEATYVIWDMIPVKEFNARICSAPLSYRKSQLNMYGAPVKHTKIIESIKVPSSVFINDPDGICEDMVKSGYEGVIVKSSESKYEYKRSFSWLKYKMMKTDEFNIIGFEEGNGKNLNSLGAILVQSLDGNIESKVGSGFSDEQRQYIWEHQDELAWTKVEIKYQEVTKDNSLRFPVFVKFRNDL